MPLFINQGKQDTSKDNFEAFEEKDVAILIEKVELNQYLPGNINLHLRLKSGKHLNRCVRDTVAYEASSPFSWRYRAVRKCAGCPYDEKESEKIDIETLLKDKILLADFTINEKDGKKYQNVVYKVMSKEKFDELFPREDLEDLQMPDYEPKEEEEVPVQTPVNAPSQDIAPEEDVPQTPVFQGDNDDSEWEE